MCHLQVSSLLEEKQSLHERVKEESLARSDDTNALQQQVLACAFFRRL